MNSIQFLSVILIICAFINLSRNASLSVYEQMKYKQLIEGQGLYNANDDIEILSKSNFKQKIYGKSNAWFVEFYNTWCGFCQRFAPSWKALGTDIQEWQGAVNVGAVDCSDNENSVLCRELEIMAYPTLRYFHENYVEGPKNIGDEVPKGSDMETHKSYLVRHMIMEQQANRGVNFPTLLPYQKPNLLHLFDETHVNAKYVFLIIEEPSSTVGPELTLDFYKYKEIGVRYATTDNVELVKTVHAEKFPYMMVITDQNKSHVFSDKLNTREGLRSVIIDYIKPNIVINSHKSRPDIFTGKWIDVEVPDINSLMEAKLKRIFKEKVKQLGDTVFQVDLESALRYSLKHEIGNMKNIKDEKMQVLRAFLQVLLKYFPFKPEGQKFLMDISNKVNSKSVIDGEEVANIVEQYDADSKSVFSAKHQWIGCEGSTPARRGYPCGLWKLFHYLTVQASHREDNPKEVLHALHGYIKNFFGCADCSSHFQKLAVAKDLEGVQSTTSAVLWLWMAHNDVNKRLAGDLTEDPQHPKIQFPSSDKCPVCRNSDNGWNYDEVLKYVKNMYSVSNINHLKYESDGQMQMSPSESTTIFAQIDTSYL